MVVQDSQQRRLEGPPATRTPQAPQPPSLHHHHSMQSHVPPHMGQPSHSISSHPGGRPSIDRAHTFPTPPASASSLMGITHQGGGYEWGNQDINPAVQNSQPLSIDTTLGNARSMPTTPAATPPGSAMQGMPSFQGQYDSSKPYYSAAPPSHTQYAPQQPLTQPVMPSYGQPLAQGNYMKSEMAPPSGRSSGGQPDSEAPDVKPDRYDQGTGQVGSAGESGPGHEPEYMHDNPSAYNSNRASYAYTSNHPVGAIGGEQSQTAPEMGGSPSQQNGSGRMTPRTSTGLPSQWPSGYNTPPRPAPVGSLYNIVSDTRGSSGNGAPSDSYSVASHTPSGYSTGMNGSMGVKRLRDDDDLDRVTRPDGRETDYESKRRKTLTDPPVGGAVSGAPLSLQPLKAGGVMPRHR